jgi:NAD(P)H-dependent FMN reductase
MVHIAIISSSVRTGRASHRVALFLKNYILQSGQASTEIIDLLEYTFPLFDERLKNQRNPSEKMLKFAEQVKRADGIIIVVPEYNGGYPASLKNVIDLLNDEWFRKPVGISTVSNGPFGGSQLLPSLQFILWKMKALVVTATFPVTHVTDTFNENGIPANKIETERRAANFVEELFRNVKANEVNPGNSER